MDIVYKKSIVDLDQRDNNLPFEKNLIVYKY